MPERSLNQSILFSYRIPVFPELFLCETPRAPPKQWNSMSIQNRIDNYDRVIKNDIYAMGQPGIDEKIDNLKDYLQGDELYNAQEYLNSLLQIDSSNRTSIL